MVTGPEYRVFFDKSAKRWRAWVQHHRERVFVGTFMTEKDAEAAVLEFSDSNMEESECPENRKRRLKAQKAKAGEQAGYVHTNGENSFIRITIEGDTYFAHHIAWFMYYGHWPAGNVRHINGIGTDNRIRNLQEENGSKS